MSSSAGVLHHLLNGLKQSLKAAPLSDCDASSTHTTEDKKISRK